MTDISQTAPMAATTAYLVVSQVKSNRVIYFTDDLSYTPPSEGDWYYISHYQGALPAGIKLSNCWGWRFNGSTWIDARSAASPSSHETLLENNRRALLRLLREKIDAVRSSYLPSQKLGHLIRQEKLGQARGYLALADRENSDSVRNGIYPYLYSLANARGLSLTEAAELIVDKARQTERVLAESESIREQLQHRIEQASDNNALEGLREILLDEIYPALSEQFKLSASNTTPKDLDRRLTNDEQRYEHTRLRVKLREKINELRRAWHSDYLLDDLLQAQKLQQAKSCLAQALRGDPIPSGEFVLLQCQAQSQGQTLADAARAVLQEYGEQMQLLERTEALNHSLLREIAKVSRPSEAKAVSGMIDDIVVMEK